MLQHLNLPTPAPQSHRHIRLSQAAKLQSCRVPVRRSTAQQLISDASRAHAWPVPPLASERHWPAGLSSQNCSAIHFDFREYAVLPHASETEGVCFSHIWPSCQHVLLAGLATSSNPQLVNPIPNNLCNM